MKKLLTFLGNGEYGEGIYTYRSRKATKSRFVQTAIYELFCQEFTDKDQIIIFLTEEAESKNWKDSIGESGKNKDKKLEGMENAWKKINPKLLQQNQIRKVRIPSQQDEKHNWELFEIILNEIDEGDEIIFDITHSFRSFPIMALIILNYARILKNASLKKLLYGCWEMNDRGTPPTAPIIDMTEMVPLLDWAYGVDSYKETGNASVIQTLTNKEVASVFQTEKSSDDMSRTEANALRTLANCAHEFHQIMQTCRAPEIPQKLNNLRKALEQAKTMEIQGFRPFEKLFGKMEEKIEYLTDRPIMDDYWAAKWCHDNGLIQQGYTLLQEGIITAICRVMGLELDDVNKRKLVSAAISVWLSEKTTEEWEGTEDEKSFMKAVIAFLNPYKDLLKSYAGLTRYRNSINHAGRNRDNIPHQRFRPKLENYLKDFRPFFEKMDQLYQDQQEGAATR